MGLEQYTQIRFRKVTLQQIGAVNGILSEYEEQGLTLTLRQLFYQLVSRDIIANNDKEYEKLSRTLNDARMAGLVDWNMIEDRTRTVGRRTRWESGKELLVAAAGAFHMDMWEGQDFRLFCVVEKDALSGVLSPVCTKYDVPLLAAKGYPSVSTLREFAVDDILPTIENGQEAVILHLGDHDPSGLDMTRDIEDRVSVFSRRSVQVIRLALNIEQVNELNPPPNYAKTTDRRFKDYEKNYGPNCWELDALRPDYMVTLVEREIRGHIDSGEWKKREAEVNSTKAKLQEIADREFSG